VEDRVDLEGDSDGRRHGAQVGWGVKEKKRKVEEEAVQRVGLYSAESRHGAWHDSVAPTHVARLSLATSAAWLQAFQRGSLVTPKHVARLFRESRHGAWRDQKG